MSLAWYLHRLRAMSPGELAHRVGEKLKKQRARGRLEGWARYPGSAITPLPGLRERLMAAGPELRGQIRQAAKTVLAGRFSALGADWPERPGRDLFPAEVWRLDPVTGGFWPGAEHYCFDIAYRHERRLGDIKYVWEFNRLQFLQPLAAHAALSSDAASIAAIEAAIASWHAANPPFRGLGWNSGIELALRAIALLVVLSLVGDRLSAACRAQIGAILHASIVWLRRYPSRYSSANNHLIAELAGAFLIALAMPGVPGSVAIVEESRRKLIDEAGRQILSDGVPAEQSPTYGAFSAEFLLLCGVVARELGQPFPPAYDDRLAVFARFIGWIALDDGRVPAIGDDDEGRVLTLGGHESAYAGSVANAVAGYRGADAPSAAPADFRSGLLGTAKTQQLAPRGQRLFAEGGYFVANDLIGRHRFNLVFDHGPLGYLSIAAHGHADALALTLAVDGKPVLVDPGTYLYHSGGSWRDWFRGTAAHNTLSLSGADQSTISGAFNWSHKARAQLEHYEAGALWSATARHDGYLKRFGVVHERSIARTEQGLVLTDRLLGGGGHPAEIAFQLAPDLSAQIEGQRVTVRRAAAVVLVLAFEPGALRVERGGEAVGGGWVSPAFGQRQPADRIVWSGTVDAAGRTVALSFEAAGDPVGADRASMALSL